MIQTKRAYDDSDVSDGKRFLVDRLWPRGVKKEELEIDDWLKELAPSTELRKWFKHESANWDEFKRRYFMELENKASSWRPIVGAARKETITLVYGARNTKQNNAIALKEFLELKL